MKIAILSTNPKLYSTQRLVEAAKQRGHEAVILNHTKCYMVVEKDAPAIYYGGKKVEGIDAVIPRIGVSVTFYGTAVVRQFEMMGIFCANNSQAIVRSRDKIRSLQILSRDGVSIPKTTFANHPNNIDDVIQLVGGAPVVIKLLEGTQGIGVILAETNRTAKSVIEAFYDVETDILVQEFIKEAQGEDIRAFVIDKEVVGAMMRKGVQGEFRSNLHRGGKAVLVELTEEEKRTALLAAKSMGLNIAGVDMVRSKEGPKVLEVNSSPGLEGIEKTTKIDIAGKIIEFVEKSVNTQTEKVNA
ncbi:MAG: 30S ribosomal protein S6--L-glutamate ligase [Bacteroidia bacterium]|nr:30S ribosomal protein S6--L-glutamate ligase [Bacteroidia bacterium]MDW8301366.1 30S ribosomal protein S6--L-glutamate ligase [Bacteroidia bacterium]